MHLESLSHVPVVGALAQLSHSYGELGGSVRLQELLQTHQPLVALVYDGKGAPAPGADQVDICLNPYRDTVNITPDADSDMEPE
jgi:hypothetical protein